MATEVDLVDIGCGNVGSIIRCFRRLGISFHCVGPENPPDGSRPLIVPGVGAFGPVMNYLRATGFDLHLLRLIEAGTPYLGICIGMQILFKTSTEAEGVPGLGVLAGDVVRFAGSKVPQIGWNKIIPTNSNWAPGYVYFVNSYYARPCNDSVVLYQASYGDPFCAAVSSKNVIAFQFHLEKSGSFGEQLLSRCIHDISRI